MTVISSVLNISQWVLSNAHFKILHNPLFQFPTKIGDVIFPPKIVTFVKVKRRKFFFWCLLFTCKTSSWSDLTINHFVFYSTRDWNQYYVSTLLNARHCGHNLNLSRKTCSSSTRARKPCQYKIVKEILLIVYTSNENCQGYLSRKNCSCQRRLISYNIISQWKCNNHSIACPIIVLFVA